MKDIDRCNDCVESLKKLRDTGLCKACIRESIWEGENKILSENRKCHFTFNIADQVSCSETGEFDDYGFPEEVCSSFPCKKYEKLINRIEHNKLKNRED